MAPQKMKISRNSENSCEYGRLQLKGRVSKTPVLSEELPPIQALDRYKVQINAHPQLPKAVVQNILMEFLKEITKITHVSAARSKRNHASN